MSNVRVLIADGDRGAVAAAQGALERGGAQVRPATASATACARATRRPPSAVP